MQVICDFDGTITLCDTTDHVLEAHASAEWRDVEAAWITGEISAAACMRRQVELIGASDTALNATLDAVAIDPHFTAFADWCEAAHIRLTIVSDGVDYFIRRVLARHGLSRLPVFANVLQGAASQRTLHQPLFDPACSAASGVCKCKVARMLGGGFAFVGDGRSDFCVSDKADVLFAKGPLADHARARRRPFHGYADFSDVRAVLAPQGPSIRREAHANADAS